MSQDPASTTTSTFGGQTEIPTNATFAFELDQRERLPGLYAGWFVGRLSCDSNRQTFIARAHYDDSEIGEGEFGVFGRPSRDTKKTVRVLAKCVRMSDDTYELKIATSGFEGHMFKEKNTHASFKERLGEGESWRDDAPLPYWVRLPGNFEAWAEPAPEKGDHHTNETTRTATDENTTPRVFLFEPEAPSEGDKSELDHRFGESKGDLMIPERTTDDK